MGSLYPKISYFCIHLTPIFFALQFCLTAGVVCNNVTIKIKLFSTWHTQLCSTTHSDCCWGITVPVGMCGNRISVRFQFLKTGTETKPKWSNPKFRFPWLFSKPNLSHTNSQYLSHSHKVLTFFTLQILSDSKWSWNLGLENRRPKCKMHTQERQFTLFCILQLIYKKDQTEPTFQNRTEPTVFLKTEPNLKNPFRTSLPPSIPILWKIWQLWWYGICCEY